jgi:hypothetical protein
VSWGVVKNVGKKLSCTRESRGSACDKACTLCCGRTRLRGTGQLTGLLSIYDMLIPNSQHTVSLYNVSYHQESVHGRI